MLEQGTHIWDWCESLRPINFWLYYVGYALIFGLGLPCLNNSLQSLYSQLLGKGRQGTMQGINQAVGCISRILGPLLMSSTFASFGPRATWLIEIALISVCLSIWCIVYRRLKPAAIEIKERNITLSRDGAVVTISRKDSTSTEISEVSDELSKSYASP